MIELGEVDMADQKIEVKRELNLFDRYLSLWVALCIILEPR